MGAEIESLRMCKITLTKITLTDSFQLLVIASSHLTDDNRIGEFNIAEIIIALVNRSNATFVRLVQFQLFGLKNKVENEHKYKINSSRLSHV